MAVFGVLKPRPTSLYHLRPPFPTFGVLRLFTFWLVKTCGCFWKARSLWTVNSVAMIAECVQSDCRSRRRKGVSLGGGQRRCCAEVVPASNSRWSLAPAKIILASVCDPEAATSASRKKKCRGRALRTSMRTTARDHSIDHTSPSCSPHASPDRCYSARSPHVHASPVHDMPSTPQQRNDSAAATHAST